jgi:carboxyl-terminal processing protease
VSQNRFARHGDIVIWKLSGFAFDPGDVDRLVDAHVKAAPAVVIDMRGNGGGFVKTFEQIAGRLFDRDITVGTIKTRKNAKPLIVKKRKSPFLGKLVVLVDADSGSAAELLARVVQLEKRGVVIGDRSSGAVMQGEIVAGVVESAQGFIFYHASVTSADLIMSDGASLERVGVTPDEMLMPSGADLAAGRDPALSRAVAVLGGSLDPVAAAALFPVEWK